MALWISFALSFSLKVSKHNCGASKLGVIFNTVKIWFKVFFQFYEHFSLLLLTSALFSSCVKDAHIRMMYHMARKEASLRDVHIKKKLFNQPTHQYSDSIFCSTFKTSKVLLLNFATECRPFSNLFWLGLVLLLLKLNLTYCSHFSHYSNYKKVPLVLFSLFSVKLQAPIF